MRNKNGIIVIEFNKFHDPIRSWSAKTEKQFIKKTLKRLKIDNSTPKYSYDECVDLLNKKTKHIFIRYPFYVHSALLMGYYNLASKEANKLGWLENYDTLQKEDSEEKIKIYKFPSIKHNAMNIINKNYTYDECILFMSIFLAFLISALLACLCFLLKGR